VRVVSKGCLSSCSLGRPAPEKAVEIFVIFVRVRRSLLRVMVRYSTSRCSPDREVADSGIRILKNRCISTDTTVIIIRLSSIINYVF